MNREIQSVEDLQVWHKAHALTLEIYKLTSQFPAYEKYALVDQIRRAASSIGANLFEGSYRTGTNEFRYFANIARGSAGEVKYFLILARDLSYITNEQFSHLNQEIDSICKMLYGLISSLRSKS
jgi:four helix bundle protein